MFIDRAREILGAILAKMFGSRNAKTLRRIEPIVAHTASLEPELAKLSDAELKAKTDEFKRRFADRCRETGVDRLREQFEDFRNRARTQEADDVHKRIVRQTKSILDEFIPEAFACVREAGKRAIGLRHFDVQILGGIVLHRGIIAEMVTGEGKTLVATLPAYLNAIAREEGKQSGVHVITTNDFLAKRDAAWMAPVYEMLGLTVGCIQADMESSERLQQYSSDVVYGQNNEFGFDYLRDNMKINPAQQVQKVRRFAIVDEVDSILIDEARTPLIISGAAQEAADRYYRADDTVRKLNGKSALELEPVIDEMIKDGWEKEAAKEKAEEPFDYVFSEKDHSAYLTERGIEKCMKHLHVENFYEGKEMGWPHHLENALRAHAIYKKDVDYVVKDGGVLIVDEFTGRILAGRRWSDGLHQAVEAKENLRIKEENQTLATITFQNFFKLYDKLAGMTGTAMTEAKEFMQIYKLDSVSIPTNRPLRRSSFPDVIYGSEKEKFDAIIDEIVEVNRVGRPVLVGTVSIEKSERLSSLLKRRGVRHDVLNAKQHEREAQIIATGGKLGRVTIATNMAGRGMDIKLGTFTRNEILDHWKQSGLAPSDLRADAADAELALARHWVREFEKYAPEKGQLSAEAVGEMGLDELRRQFERRCREFRVSPYKWGTSVTDLGGLHIVGSERHEARRIDNQLRGRSGRQGDPGSSRFFLSLEDDLMRIFASEWVRNFLRKAGISNGQPLESGLVTRSIEKAQRRVEETNYARRKRLLEYDQVMNEQRTLIYNRRQEILEGRSLREHAMEMIEDVCGNAVDTYISESLPQADWDWYGLERWAKRKFGLAVDRKDVEARYAREVEGKLAARVKEAYEAREKQYGEVAIRELERFIQLDVIDKKWKDHLRDMDHLKEGIYLRSYAQKDPKLEYKREGYALFREMMVAMYEEVTDLILRAQPIRTEAVMQDLAERWAISSEEHAEATSGLGEASREMAAQSEHGGSEWKPVQTIRRDKPKIRPNDPCPCGSGKKYKKCCARRNRAG
ncbi:MAG: preprotein translocase subunit SecA [Planctomycetota bacterium]